MAACAARSEPCVAVLVMAGADVEAVSARGERAIHAACDAGAVAAWRLLLASGADCSARDAVRGGSCARGNCDVMRVRACAAGG